MMKKKDILRELTNLRKHSKVKNDKKAVDFIC